MTRLKYCHIQGKVRYPTYYAAKRVMAKMLNKEHHNYGACYRCPNCHDWHITHFREIIDCDNVRIPSKKQLKSKRLREKKKIIRESRPSKNDKLYPITEQMRRITPIMQSLDPNHVAELMSQGFGEMKMFVGGTTYCALTMMHEAMVMLEKCPAYRHDAKKQLRQARAEWDRYERELKHPAPGSLRFFCLAEMNEQYRKRYGNITDDEYFEFWSGVGGNMYMKCKPHITALTYKYERYMRRHDVKDYKAYSTAMCADALLQLSVIVFDIMSKDVSQDVPSTVPSFCELCAPLNPHRIQVAFRRAIDTMFLSSLPELTDEEMHSIKLSTDDISCIWSDPLAYMDIQQDTIEDYAEDVFRTKGEAKKLMRLNGERRAALEKLVKESKINNLKK